MKATVIDRLSALRNYATRYEVVGIHSDGRKILAGYTSRKSRAGLIAVLRNRGEAWQALTGVQLFQVGKSIRDGLSIGDWSIRFSGRTQREAISSSSELTYIS